jgi:hypothetical protein
MHFFMNYLFKSMPHLIALAVSLLFIFPSFAQKIIFEKQVELKQGNLFQADNRDVYPVVDDTDQRLILFFTDKRKIGSISFSNGMTIIDSLGIGKPKGKTLTLQGCSQSDKVYNLFFKSSEPGEFVIFRFDFKNNDVTQHSVQLPFDKERYVAAVGYKNKFYVLSVKKRTSILKLYTFTDHVSYSVQSFDFKDTKFRIPPSYTLDDALAENSTQYIDNEIPHSIEEVSIKSKLYCYENKIVLTLDNLFTRTKVISINLQTLESTLDVYKKGGIDCGSMFNASSNSYLYMDNLYQFYACPSGMKLKITNLTTKDSLKSYQTLEDDSLNFSNSPITLESTYANDRELSRVKRFLRRVAANQAGLWACKSSDGIVVTMGGYQKIEQQNNMSLSSPSTPISTPYGTFSAPSSPGTYSSFGTYGRSQSFYFKSLLDTHSFEHKEGEIADNKFDKIRTFTKTCKDDIIAQTIFKQGDGLVLCYYLKYSKTYMMRLFTD